MSMIKTKKLTFEYIHRDEEGNVEGITKAVNGVDLDIKEGDFIAILGHNGSGKSTLAKHMNAILTPSEGAIYVAGMDTRDDDHIWDIRKNAGMVFQNPDNQIIGQVVEAVGMYAYRKHSPNKLSGGQKQRVSIAGVLAMHPKCIVLDEPTAMLDPQGRKEVIRAVRALNEVENITIILITHYMEEVVYADKVFVMDKGSIKMEGTPREIFSRVDELQSMRLTVPQVTLLAEECRKMGMPFSKGILTTKEFMEELKCLLS